MALTLVLGLAAPVSAQQSPPTRAETVVVTASVEPLAFEAMARAVQVLSRRDLELIGVDSVIDALRLVPGVDPRARGPLDVQTDFSVRGATFGQSLVLVDGFRINDSQSGHHNGDIPMAVSGIDRIEVLTGSSSAVHGADALGGTINVITRRDGHATADVSAGQHGLVQAQGSFSGGPLPRQLAVTAWGSRSSGFMFDRDFALGGVAARMTTSPEWSVDARHQRKAFGANGFYGNSPSKEWTDQTLVALGWRSVGETWTTSVRGQARNHGDHFRWDINRPGFAENRHRTNALEMTAVATRSLGSGRRATAGATAGGNWVDSSNLGDHDYGHGAAFVEVASPLGSRATVQGALRVDHYSSFGTAWSPSLATGVWLTPEWRLRGSVAHAFRIPTYTELYYTDPGHQALSDLEPERGWSVEGGADWLRDGWLVTASAFRRWDDDVIDWVKVNATDKWNTINVRDVTTTGVELSASRSWADTMVRVHVASQSVDAPTLTLLSKYVLEYARHTVGGAVAIPLPPDVRLGLRLDHRRRFNGPAYTLVGLRLTRQLRRAELFLDVSNLLDEDYYEIAGVEMPGRWIRVGVAIR